MKVLIVEDEEYEGLIEDVSDATGNNAECLVATNRDDAVHLLNAEEFDLILCDLRIGPRPNSADKSVDYGFEVYSHAESVCPGVPILIITGQGDNREARRRIAKRGSSDTFGPNIAMTDFIYKTELEEYTNYIRAIYDIINEIDTGPVLQSEYRFEEGEARLIKAYSKKLGASRTILTHLQGMSPVKAFKAELFDKDDHLVASVFVKIGPAKFVIEEDRRHRDTAQRLPAGTFASSLELYTSGGRKSAALFLNYAKGYSATFFESIIKSPDMVNSSLIQLRSNVDEWQSSARQVQTTVGDLRRQSVTDEEFQIFQPNLHSRWKEVEATEVNINFTIQHGDLHGANILVSPGGSPLLVDLASSGEFPTCFDVITLELSLAFHPSSPFRSSVWPSETQCNNWFDNDLIATDHPLANSVSTLREWQGSFSDLEIAIVTYCQALWLLRHEKTKQALLYAIANAALVRVIDLIEAA